MRPIFPCWPRTQALWEDGACEALGCTDATEGQFRQRWFCSRHLAELRQLLSPFLSCGCSERGWCVPCRAVAMARKRVLLVGERGVSLYERRPINVLTGFDRFRDRLLDGAFEFGRSRDRLVNAGVRWDDALNLLPAAPIGSWDADEARRSAEQMLPTLLQSYDLIVVCGVRARQAFHTHKKILAIPHPSGRSHVWNDPKVRSDVGEQFLKVLRDK